MNFQIGYPHKFSKTGGIAVAKWQDKVVTFEMGHFVVGPYLICCKNYIDKYEVTRNEIFDDEFKKSITC